MDPKTQTQNGPAARLVNGGDVIAESSIYGAPSFALPSSQSVTEKYGRKSCAMLDVTIPIKSSGMIVQATIWARLESKANGETVGFDIGLPRNCRIPDPTFKQAYTAHIARHAKAWKPYGAAQETVKNLLLNGKAAAKDGVDSDTLEAMTVVRAVS